MKELKQNLIDLSDEEQNVSNDTQLDLSNSYNNPNKPSFWKESNQKTELSSTTNLKHSLYYAVGLPVVRTWESLCKGGTLGAIVSIPVVRQDIPKEEILNSLPVHEINLLSDKKRAFKEARDLLKLLPHSQNIYESSPAVFTVKLNEDPLVLISTEENNFYVERSNCEIISAQLVDMDKREEINFSPEVLEETDVQQARCCSIQ